MIGRQIGNYKILKELGKGGMGVVYKAHQITLGRMVAMKVLPQHLTKDQSFVKRFENEARAIAKLNHPNIVQIFDIGQQDDVHFYTMEYIEGPSLDTIVYKEGFLEVDRAANIVLQVATALLYAHSQGIVHRDIKPSNIMIDGTGRVRVTDFGLALQQRSTRLTVAGGIVGTPEYMSPEQATGQTATLQSDIYSLGVVFYELLTGKVPYEGDAPLAVLNKMQTSEPQWPRAINSNIPVEAETIIRTMMARNPTDRYANCREIIQSLQQLRAGQPVSIRTRRSQQPSRLLTALVVILILAGVAAAGVILVLRGSADEQTDEPIVIERFLDIGADLTLPDPGGPVDVTPPPAEPYRPGEIERLARDLAVHAEQLKEIRWQYGQGNESAFAEKFDDLKRNVGILEQQVGDLRELLYPDRLVLDRGNVVTCRIADESLEKVHIESAVGPADIPRDGIRLTVYATSEEGHRADDIGARLPSIDDTIRDLKKEMTAFERMTKHPGKLQASAGSSGQDAAGTPAESVENTEEGSTSQEEHPSADSMSTALSKENWRVKSTCGKGTEVSFSGDTLSITTDDRAGRFGCIVTLAALGSLKEIPEAMEVTAKIEQIPGSTEERVQSFLIVTFSDGALIDYCFIDSQPDRTVLEEAQTSGKLTVRRPELLLGPTDGIRTIRFPLAKDAEKLGARGSVDSIQIVHRHDGPARMAFSTRFHSVEVIER